MKLFKISVRGAAVLLLFLTVLISSAAFAEEYDEYVEDSYEEEEEEFIPDTYYEPIQTNDLPGWPQGQPIQAAAGIVMDLDTDAILYAKNITDAHYPASITKIMTTLVALEHSSLDDVIACGDEVYDIEENSSNLGIQPGEHITMRQALYGLMLESANDLGNAIAIHVAGSIDGFAQLMNEKAQQLGCVNTHFTNPHGLHNEDHYTCAYDMAKIAQAAYANPDFKEITGTRESSIPPTDIVEEERYFANHQRLMQPDSDYYQPWCTGGKTGYTSDAWNTLVTYGEQNGLRLVCVLLRENGSENNYLETAAIMNDCFSRFVRTNVTDGVRSRTFYDILDLERPDTGTTIYRIPQLDQAAVSVSTPGLVTIPADADTSSLTVSFPQDAPGELTFLYEGWEVGHGGISFAPLPTGISLPYHEYRDMEELMKQSSSIRKVREVTQTASTAWNTIVDTVTTVRDKAKAYVRGNTMTVLLTGGFLLVILLILIVILIRRLTRETRIARKRQLEELALLRKAEKIDQMSAAQIEEELREAMEAERIRRQKEMERIAKAKEEERKLRETEELLEQIRNEHFDVKD